MTKTKSKVKITKNISGENYTLRISDKDDFGITIFITKSELREIIRLGVIILKK